MTPTLNLPPQENLVMRAVESFSKEFGTRFEGTMTLVKNVPTGAGLGGGSSDAAGVLRILAEACGVKPTRSQRLWRVARSLGADVPFFLLNRPAWCTGRGDICWPLERFRPLWLVLVHSPMRPIPTAWAYRELDRIRRGRTLRLGGRPAWVLQNDWDVPHLENDFEEVAFKRYPSLRRVREALAKVGAQSAIMSGSGSSFFGTFRSQAEAQRAHGQLKRQNFEAVVCRSL